MSRRQFGRIRKLNSGRWQARYPVGNGELRAGANPDEDRGHL